MQKTPPVPTRADLLALHTPSLDAFRTALLTTKTSELLVLFSGMDGGSSLFHALGLSVDAQLTPAQGYQVMAASLAISDEIDRRLPVVR